MQDDVSESGPRSSATGRIKLGSFVLEVGDPAGSVLVPTSTPGAPPALRRAVTRSRKRGRRAAKAIEVGLNEASDVTRKLECGEKLVKIALGQLDAKSITDGVDALVALLTQLDREGRYKEALRAARSLAILLALIERWVELLDTLNIALRGAETLGEPLDQAWALHELGTLHLAAGRHSDADSLLGRAREIRERCGDGPGLAVTNRNLQVLCHTLRQLLHPPPKRLLELLARKPVLALIAAAALLLVGGTAGVVLADAFHRDGSSVRVVFSFTPQTPHAGQSIVFAARATDARDPAASYTWVWGDGDPAPDRVQTHRYRQAGSYTVVLVVRDEHGKVIGRATQVVRIQRPVVEDGPNASFSFQPQSPIAGASVSFDASSSFDPRASIAKYTWSFGDGDGKEGVKVSHSFARAGIYRASLTVIDKQGLRGTLVQRVAVSARDQGKQQAEVHLNCPSSSVPLGQAAVASGWIGPGRASTVTVTYVSPAGREFPRLVTSEAHGSYKAGFIPEEPGPWSVQGTVAGDRRYQPSTSTPCAFAVEATRAETTVSINCPSAGGQVGQAVTATGAITPATTGASVAVAFVSPRGQEFRQTVASSGEGAYTAGNTPEESGSWTVSSARLGEIHDKPSVSKTCRFTVEPKKVKPPPSKERTTTLLDCRSSSVSSGEAVTASGSIRPARAGATVTVTYTGPSGKELETVMSEGDGHYGTSYTPREAGKWSIRSVQQEDSSHLASVSNTCVVTVGPEEPTTTQSGKPILTKRKAQTTTHLTCPPGEASIGEAVEASGSIMPARADATVTVTYTSPSGEAFPQKATSYGEGLYTTSYALGEAGHWTITSMQQGDTSHLPSQAPNTCRITVEGTEGQEPE